ncbi:hypothetical protein GC093_08500 [Paenibacillus sp. LMG 31456]|uniref:Uncharacterized protein n=1 Tax=Paenibacillus foliorum TaxID=2654974 RepID=A0A972GSW8_9BACL|nr:hypothetical protein [Paenibacillus foliorum]NOU93257.1 hypothetical protein [Paenibacillus foliorum]
MRAQAMIYKYKWLIITSTLLIVLCFVYTCLINKKTSLYEDIERVVVKNDSSFKEIAYIHVLKEKLLVFYETQNNELAGILVEKGIKGYKISDYLSKNSFDSSKGLSWQGTERIDQQVHLLYGTILDPAINQVFLVSEANKSATIIKNGSRTMWFSLMDHTLNLPITIEGLDKNGNMLYTFGDISFWSNRVE